MEQKYISSRIFCYYTGLFLFSFVTLWIKLRTSLFILVKTFLIPVLFDLCSRLCIADIRVYVCMVHSPSMSVLLLYVLYMKANIYISTLNIS